MHTLREIGTFVGIASGPVSMRRIAEIVPVLTGAERTSMRAMIAGLQRLPPVTLNVEVVGAAAGVVPFLPSFRVLPGTGVVRHTTFSVLLPNGQPAPGTHPIDVGDFVGDLRIAAFGDPGVFHVSVLRVGVSSTGVVAVEKTFTITATAQPVPVKPPPDPPPEPQGPTCGVELDLDQPGGAGIDGIRVFGGGFGFSPPETILIMEGDGIAASTRADTLGRYSVHIGVVKTTPPTLHTYRAHGQTTRRTSNNAGITV